MQDYATNIYKQKFRKCPSRCLGWYVTNIQKQKYQLYFCSFYPVYRSQIQRKWLIKLGEGWLPDIEIRFLVAQHSKAILATPVKRQHHNEDITLSTVFYLLIALFIFICVLHVLFREIKQSCTFILDLALVLA